MPETVKFEIAENADLIVNGYAFMREGGDVKVTHLRTGKAALINRNKEVIETSMDDMELSMALGYLRDNEKYMD